MSFFELTVIKALFWGMFLGIGLLAGAWYIVEARRLQRREWSAYGTLFWQAMTSSRTVDNRVDYAHQRLIADLVESHEAGRIWLIPQPRTGPLAFDPGKETWVE